MTRLTAIAHMMLMAALALPAAAATGLTLNQTIISGTVRQYEDPRELTLAEGFWAQAGSDVTATIHVQQGYYVDKSPLDEKDKQYTSNEGRTFIVAGCVPKNLPIKGPVGSVWVACNDLDYVKDKVVESTFISCLDLFPNGIVSGASIKEINNRTWKSFRFSCRDLGADGKLVSPAQKADFLFNYEREGTLYEVSGSDIEIFYGIKEYQNSPQMKEALSGFRFLHGPAVAIENGERSDPPNSSQNYFRETDIVPTYPPGIPLIKTVTHDWMCPPTMVLTGMAIGHNPDNKGNDTRPIYLLGECRKLLHNP